MRASVSTTHAETTAAAPARLADGFDALLVDLDGTLFRGSAVVPGARESLAAAGLPVVYVTNNASKAPSETATHLRELGYPAAAGDVMTSAQAAVEMALAEIGPGSVALVVGADSFRDLAAEAGFRVVASADDHPDVVLQGLSRELTWSDLAEGCLAIRSGARWIASNVDATLPAERGLLPGNGALVAALRAATESEPVVAGKPAAGVLHSAAAAVEASRPLVVGDRLDTDIQGAVSAGMDALMVLTGVSSVADVVVAGPDRRPTHLGADMTCLLEPEDVSRIAVVPGLDRRVVDGVLHVVPGTLDGLALARAVIAEMWDTGVSRVTCAAADRDRLTAAGLPVD